MRSPLKSLLLAALTLLHTTYGQECGSCPPLSQSKAECEALPSSVQNRVKATLASQCASGVAACCSLRLSPEWQNVAACMW